MPPRSCFRRLVDTCKLDARPHVGPRGATDGSPVEGMVKGAMAIYFSYEIGYREEKGSY